jgi:hypothetical protein
VPGAPTNVTGVPGNALVKASWSAPASDGGSPITGYTVTAVPGGQTATSSGSTTTATVKGLTNGIAYRFTVSAANANGTSPPSASSDPVTPEAPGPPGTPAITGVTARDSAAELSWSPPDTGTAGLTGYTVTVYSAGSKVKTVSEAASATDAIVTGLTNGTQYVLTLKAVNSSGPSQASPPSAAMTPQPAAAPMAPAGVQVFPQNGELQVGWSQPPDGGSPITGYTVTVSPADSPPVTTGAGTTVATVTGLKNGTAYTVSVTAKNAAGTSPVSTAGPVTPKVKIVPGVPGNLTATVTASGSVGLQWTPPASSGTSPITSYTVTASPGGKSVTSTTCGTSLPVVCTAAMSGLTSTTGYTFTVTATSAAGTSTPGAATQAVIPTLKVKKAPVILSSASLAALRSAGSDGTLIFEQPPAQVTKLKKGNLVQVNPVAAAPQGYLGIVQTTGVQGSLYVVTTQQASLDDEYTTYQAALDVPFSPASINPFVPGIKLARPVLRGRAVRTAASPDGVQVSWQNGSLVLSLQASLLGGDSLDGQDSSPGVGPMAEIDGSVTLTPILKAFDHNGFIGFTIGGSVKADLSANLGAHLAAQETVPLAAVPGLPVETPLGSAVPKLTISAVLNTNGSVGITYNAGYSDTVTGTCMIRKSLTNHTGDSCTGSHSQSATETHTALYGAMDITAGIQFGASMSFEFGAVTPGLTLTPAIDVSVDTSANPWWKVSLDLSLGVSMKLTEFTIYQNDSVINFSLDIADAGGPFNGLFITPAVANVAPGKSQSFQAATAAGPVTTTDWAVIAGPGSITSAGKYTAPANALGAAVIQAVYNGLTARAGVVFQGLNAPVLDSGTRGLVDAAVASWKTLSGSQPDSYQVIAYALNGLAGVNPVETVGVPGPENFAYLPGLQPGVEYLVGVQAFTGTVSTGSTESVSQPAFLTALSPQPSQLAGISFDGDIATSPEDQRPDDTGTAGTGGAVISGNGQYAFFYTEARSNLAPAAFFSVGNESIYLVREDLAAHAIEAASVVSLSGGLQVPVPAAEVEVTGNSVPAPGWLVTNDTGTAVGFVDSDTGLTFVYNFVSGLAWQVDHTGGVYGVIAMAGLSNDGSVVAYSALNGSSFDIYRETSAGTKTLVGACECANGNEFSMSGDGNLIAYGLPPTQTGADSIHLYDAATGKNADLFPANTTDSDSLADPIISEDGTHLALYAGLLKGSSAQGLVIKAVSGGKSTTVTASDVSVPSVGAVPLAISNDGSSVLYDAQTASLYGKFMIDQNGGSTAVPDRADSYPETASLTADGSSLIYTLWYKSTDSTQTKQPDINFPGVFDWQVG